MSDTLRALLRDLAEGRLPAELPADVEYREELEALLTSQREVQRLAGGLARGDLHLAPAKCRGPVVGSLRALEASLRHLTWQTKEIAAGDYTQHVDFMGEFATAFNAMVLQLAERRAMEAQLRQSQKNQAIGQLSDGLAHEINTPAQFVRDNLDFLRDAYTSVWGLLEAWRALPPGDDAARAALLEREATADLPFLSTEVPRAFSDTKDGVHRIAQIVAAMRAFSRPDQGEPVPTDLVHELETTLLVAAGHLGGITVERQLGPLPQVPCHPGELKQTFLALLTNAAQAIAAAHRTPGHLLVRSRADAEAVYVDVQDDGCGIPLAIRERVFEPFFTTREVGQGTGQGLALARTCVVEHHHGTLTFQTEEGKGTTFTVRLPLAGSGSTPSAEATSSTD